MSKFIWQFFIMVFIVQEIFAKKIEIKLLDRTDRQRVEQVRQLFKDSACQSLNSADMHDIEQWILSESYDILIAVNQQNIICAALLYFTYEKNTRAFLRTIVVDKKYAQPKIVLQLLSKLEKIVNTIDISTNLVTNFSIFAKVLSKHGYKQTESFINMKKKIDPSECFTQKKLKNLIRFVDSTNEQEVGLFTQLFDADEVGNSRTTEEMQEFMQYKRYAFLVLINENEEFVAGLIYQTLAHSLSVYVLSVHKKYRRCGFATEMLQFLQMLAQQQGFSAITLSVLPTNSAARKCYKNFGFIEENVKLKMQKELKTQ